MRSLARFIEAQDRGGAYDVAIAELRAGRKRSHWMWFVFPQLTGLGSSQMARTYAIDSLAEARAYLAEPLLADRLRSAATLVLTHADRPVTNLLGPVDTLKLRSSMTLFHIAAQDEPVFAAVLDRCFGGEPDPLTVARIVGATPRGPTPTALGPDKDGAMTDDGAFGELLARAASIGAAYRTSLSTRPVFPPSLDRDALRRAFGDLRDGPTPPLEVLDELVTAAEPGLVASGGGRYFGFVVGGALEAATAADVLTAAWDQLAYNAVSSPAAAVVEEVAGAWLKELLLLPPTASFGFATGAQGANTILLAAARHEVLGRVGWDVEARGLRGAPRVRVVVTAERHGTIDRSIRLLGLGSETVEPIETADDGAIRVDALRAALAARPPDPTIVCLQAGNVNSGAFDALGAATAVAHDAGAWVHVDGAFGLWAGASPARRQLVDGVATADSWTTDGHKWLNVPYDCGYAFCAHPDAHAAAASYTAAYLSDDDFRAPGDFVLESSRRARGFATWAALRQLGRSGVADLVDRSCANARRLADQLAGLPNVEIRNDVVLNQVLVRFGDDDATTDRVIDLVQRSGECWMGGTTWHGMRLMRISVSGYKTSTNDVDRTVAAIATATSAANRSG